MPTVARGRRPPARRAWRRPPLSQRANTTSRSSRARRRGTWWSPARKAGTGRGALSTTTRRTCFGSPAAVVPRRSSTSRRSVARDGTTSRSRGAASSRRRLGGEAAGPPPSFACARLHRSRSSRSVLAVGQRRAIRPARARTSSRAACSSSAGLPRGRARSRRPGAQLRRLVRSGAHPGLRDRPGPAARRRGEWSRLAARLRHPASPLLAPIKIRASLDNRLPIVGLLGKPAINVCFDGDRDFSANGRFCRVTVLDDGRDGRDHPQPRRPRPPRLRCLV